MRFSTNLNFFQMRARRLRRLGLMAGANFPTEATTSSITSSTPDISLDAQKNKISSAEDHDYEGRITELDESEHKQKLQKFDEDMDVRHKKDTFLNNNEDSGMSNSLRFIMCLTNLNYLLNIFR